jgi:hypothetical protein
MDYFKYSDWLYWTTSAYASVRRQRVAHSGLSPPGLMDGLCRATELGKLETMFDATDAVVANESLLIAHLPDDPITDAMREWVARRVIVCGMPPATVAATGLGLSFAGVSPQ